MKKIIFFFSCSQKGKSALGNHNVSLKVFVFFFRGGDEIASTYLK
jgi:hypothetical protein